MEDKSWRQINTTVSLEEAKEVSKQTEVILLWDCTLQLIKVRCNPEF
jgi:hypothetical protein